MQPLKTRKNTRLTDLTDRPLIDVTRARARTITVQTVSSVRSVRSPESGLPVLLALDLGSTLGWAVRLPDGAITSGTVEFRPGRFEGGGMAWLRFRSWLDGMVRTVGAVQTVFFEEVRRHAGTGAAHVYGGFVAHLTAWCEHQGVPYRGVPVGTIKRSATGKGNAPKEAVIASMRARGFSPADDNEADALALLDWAIREAEAGR